MCCSRSAFWAFLLLRHLGKTRINHLTQGKTSVLVYSLTLKLNSMSKSCECKRCLLEVGKTDEPGGTKEIWATQPSCHTSKYLLAHKNEEKTHWFYYSSLDYCGIQTRSSAAPNIPKVKLQLWLHPRTEAMVCLRLFCSIKYLPAWSPPQDATSWILTEQNILISPPNPFFYMKLLTHKLVQTAISGTSRSFRSRVFFFYNNKKIIFIIVIFNNLQGIATRL